MDATYEWFSEWVHQHLALCMTWAYSLSTEQMLVAFSLDPQATSTRRFSELSPDEPPTLLIGERSGWAYGLEPFSSRGARAETLMRLSMGTKAFCLSYTQTISSFVYAERGEIVSGFDLTAPHIRYGRDPARFESGMEQAGFLSSGIPDPPAMGARFLQAALGVVLDPDILEQLLVCADFA